MDNLVYDKLQNQSFSDSGRNELTREELQILRNIKDDGALPLEVIILELEDNPEVKSYAAILDRISKYTPAEFTKVLQEIRRKRNENPNYLDPFIYNQATVEQSLIELVTNGIDASKNTSVGKFGIGSISSFPRDIERKWTMSIQNWNLILSQLAISFEGRLNLT